MGGGGTTVPRVSEVSQSLRTITLSSQRVDQEESPKALQGPHCPTPATCTPSPDNDLDVWEPALHLCQHRAPCHYLAALLHRILGEWGAEQGQAKPPPVAAVNHYRTPGPGCQTVLHRDLTSLGLQQPAKRQAAPGTFHPTLGHGTLGGQVNDYYIITHWMG
ncbi:hypothetical protein chiPu_0021597 [Chiloscyllium punctatum]|uniref:Uncharacterized protein n=1 Tax=Chiloscyllium punctatum TaxID=137246 RepID=A0A401RIG0_CHIPU|nr:hypothetical protein [Chiloscyllium punctatum]